MFVGSCWFCDRSLNIICIQTTWHATLVAMPYLSFTEDRITMGCFFESHDTTLVPKLNVYPYVIFMSFMFPPLSLSVYPMILKFYEVEHIMPRSFMPLTYLIILLPACQWEYFGDSMNLEIRLTPYMISSLITVKYIRFPTSLLNNVESTVDPSSYLLNFKLVNYYWCWGCLAIKHIKYF